MSFVRALARWSFGAAALACFLRPASAAEKREPSFYAPQPAVETIDLNMYARIRDEGFHHSHVMQFAGALTDGIGHG